MEGQLVDDDNQVAVMARRTAKALAHGEKVFVPVVIRAIRQRCGLTQREAGLMFGTGEKSFEKYESGEIHPSAPRLTMRSPPPLLRHGSATITMCSRRGPCAPNSKVCSMSADRDGPVMKLSVRGAAPAP